MMKSKWNKQALDTLYNKDGKTLQEIGDMYGVSRERIRQVMQKLGLQRTYNHSQAVRNGSLVKYKTLEEYLAAFTEHQREHPNILRRFLPALKCSECGWGDNGKKNTNIHIHHITYPATSLDDIQILCASCHQMKHRKGITYARQLDIYSQYEDGAYYKDLAKQYGVSGQIIHYIIKKIREGGHSVRSVRNKEDRRCYSSGSKVNINER